MRATSKAPDLESLRPFDSCVSLGRVVRDGVPESFNSADELLAMMNRYCIAEALVHDHHARLVHPRDHGNRRLLDAIRGQSRLHPCWVIEPPKKPGRDPARALVEETLAAGVRAVRLPMKALPPLPWVWEDLAAELEEHRVPSFLDFGEVGPLGALSDSDADGVHEIARAHPELPLVLSGVFGGLGVHPAVLPMVRRLPNVYLDTAGILEYWREVARDAGPERVLFFTGAPFVDPGIYVSNVQYARGLDEAAKRLISGDNLRGLLEAVR
jgi:predicted TIM-barrel fold metal-dependent hydrolase